MVCTVALVENPFVENVKSVMQMTSTVNAFGAPAWGAPAMAPQGVCLRVVMWVH